MLPEYNEKLTGEGSALGGLRGLEKNLAEFSDVDPSGNFLDEEEQVVDTKPEEKVKKEEFSTGEQEEGLITKIDPAKRLVFGWAYVAFDTNGMVNVDKSGDFIDDIEEVEKAAYDFVMRSRQGDVYHTNVKTSDVVESVVFTPEKLEKMGIPPGVIPLGWWVGFKVHDPMVWDMVEKGLLRSFSIHGKGIRNKV